MSNRFAVLPQYLYPKQALTTFAGWVAGKERGAVTTWIVRRFVTKYSVNMAEAMESDITRYASFNEFFTRQLKPGARPIADAPLVSPVDGAISQFGPISGTEGDQIFQAKGHRYTTTALVGGDAALARLFKDGSFATLYLSPRDYHRIHMPCDGRLLRMIHVPGALFSVNPTTARGVPGLFARNERVVCVFEGERGPFVLVLVGATIVGSMATVWHGVVNPRGAEGGAGQAPLPGRTANPSPSGGVREWRYEGAQQITLRKGQEMGRFLLGSTVVMLFPRPALVFNPGWAPGGPIRLGEPMTQEDARASSPAGL